MGLTSKFCGQRVIWDALCFVLGLVPLVVFRGLGRFPNGIFHVTGFLLACTLLPNFIEHCVRCDRLFGLSNNVGFGLCHVDRGVGDVLFDVVFLKMDNQLGGHVEVEKESKVNCKFFSARAWKKLM